jgi:uncharacterized membrane protein YkvI
MVKKSSKKGVFETIEAQVVKEAGNFVRDKVKQKVLRIGEISILIILGFILISFGIANILASFYPILGAGYNYLLLGIVFLIISFILKV